MRQTLGSKPATTIALRVPVITQVVAAIAIPVELRRARDISLGFSIDAPDVLGNIVGFVAVGVVLAEIGFLRAVLLGALISSFAEAGQLFMVHRDPSVIDFVSNVIGTMLGAAINLRWRIPTELRMNWWKASLAATMALVIIAGIRITFRDAPNPRGMTSPGSLEAYWNFDESDGRVALDSSMNHLNGRFHNEPKRIDGVRGRALSFDGVRDYIDAGHASAFRLRGSMTISAWIKSRSFPKDDAAIVSQFGNDLGYQLDTTVDEQIRGIGFKLTNACGHLVARYGTTPLMTGVWYFVAGVYNAGARTLDVYLNGKLDNGPIVGAVTASQHSSRSSVTIGRRSDLKGFEFDGSIDEVHIYSFALTPEEINSDMHTGVIQHSAAVSSTPTPRHEGDACYISTQFEDSKIPAGAALLGALVAIACIGLRPSGGMLLCLATSIAAGCALLPLMPSSLPAISRWTMPVVSLVGGWSIGVSLR